MGSSAERVAALVERGHGLVGRARLDLHEVRAGVLALGARLCGERHRDGAGRGWRAGAGALTGLCAPAAVVVVQNASVLDLKKALRRHVQLRQARQGGVQHLSW
ncbi:small nuclear ribonucleoprotein 25kDa (U11/U12) [Columba livia]|uniref:Small nuclear ribonucleoprotein 25kDa (U11/U12) n=1 Tax=Columba livia TaxID=8932 RepID=A0A2I0M468_COLLI|nr:small nuclear ribonucleoprotein 25kDa (U11/U12) [Columba livia]